MKHELARLAARIFDTPLAIEEGKLAVILQVLGPRLGDFSLSEEVREIADRAGAIPAVPRDRASLNVQGGIATIDVVGTLVHRGSPIDAMSGLTSYEQLKAEIGMALADPSVQAILLNIDSPGGEIAGLFDCSDAIFEANQTKPVIAVAADMAASAAYVIASAASKFYVSEGGPIGHIGVIVPHVESTADAAGDRAVKITRFYGGALKKDFAGGPLSPEGRSVIQNRANGLYELMTSRIASYRGISQDGVKATEAAIYLGAEAVALGLADGTAHPREVLAQLTGKSTRELLQTSAISLGRHGGSRRIEPAPSGKQEVHMDPTKKNPGETGGGDVLDFASMKQRMEAVEAENAKLKAKAELDVIVSTEKAKAAVLEKHQARGAFTAPMLASVKKLAEHMSATELDAALAGYPSNPALVNPTAKTFDTPAAAIAAITDAPAADAAKPGYQLDADAKELAVQFGWSEKTLEAYDGIEKVQITERGAVAIYKSGKRALLKDLNAGRA